MLDHNFDNTIQKFVSSKYCIKVIIYHDDVIDDVTVGRQTRPSIFMFNYIEPSCHGNFITNDHFSMILVSNVVLVTAMFWVLGGDIYIMSPWANELNESVEIIVHMSQSWYICIASLRSKRCGIHRMFKPEFNMPYSNVLFIYLPSSNRTHWILRITSILCQSPIR